MTWSDTTITSQRLALRPFTAADADEAFACITPTLTRYLSFEPPSAPADFEAVWRGWLREIAAGTDFNFTLRERASGRFTGLLGLHRSEDDAVKPPTSESRMFRFGQALGFALLVAALLNGLTMLNAPYYAQDFVKGLVLVLALMFTFGLAHRAR